MIQKIRQDEYLKRYDNMTATERGQYLERVGEWLSNGARMLTPKTDALEACLQNILQVSMGWNSEECQAFEEGARLLSALVGIAETKLPDTLYAISAKRTIKKMYELLWEVEEAVSVERLAVSEEAVSVERLAVSENPQPSALSPQPSALNPEPLTVNHEPKGVGSLVPVRPKHIDQYVHLLPQKTQEKAAMVRDLLRELDEAREKMRLLMDAPDASADDRAAWAKKATSLDDKVRSIYKELDTEWENLVKSGKVAVDDFGNAHVIDAENGDKNENENNNENNNHQPSDISHQPSPNPEPKGRRGRPTAEEKEDKQRRAALIRKWLIDTRNAVSEEQKKKWIDKYKMMVKLGGPDTVTEKVREIAKYYGVDIEKIKVKS